MNFYGTYTDNYYYEYFTTLADNDALKKLNFLLKQNFLWFRYYDINIIGIGIFISEHSVRDSDIMISRDSEIHALAAPRQAVEA